MSRLGAMLQALALATSAAAAAAAPLRFSIPEGGQRNEFFRDGPVAAHLLLESGAEPRVVFAFPAGNSGAALWLAAAPGRLDWRDPIAIEPLVRSLPDGSLLRGVRASVTAVGGPVTIARALMGSIRTIRDYGYTGAVPAGIELEPARDGRTLTWRRRRLDGAPGYLLSIEVRTGQVIEDGSGAIVLAPGEGGMLSLDISALTGDAPLAPLERDRLLTDEAADDPRLRQILEFLSYEEKLLAGSWRFNTYFGRDTLMSLRLLAPVLQPQVVESGLESVLARLSESGEVAHEEDIGEYAVLRHRDAGEPLDDTPIYDYKMIDDDFMLPIVAAHYLIESPDGRRRAEAFLAGRSASGRTRGTALASNLRFVVEAAAPFAQAPAWEHLIGLMPGENAGNWRDSGEGLGGGRYPFDVNAALVPAALAAVARLAESGLLGPYLDREDMASLRAAAATAETWRTRAPRLFEVRIESAAARAAIRDYARSIRVDPAPALAAVAEEAVRFHAVALDEGGKPVPVLNSDESFALLFLEPSPVEVERIAVTLTRPFPAGLMTGAGLLVANPAFSARNTWQRFDRNRYHGTVVWSWHQALLRAGIDRQLGRNDLPATARATLAAARARLERAIATTSGLRGAELWSWSESGGAYRVEPFGQSAGHETESNAAQLWSAVHLTWR